MITDDFDPCREAMISPCDFLQKIEGMPKVAVTCFDRNIINSLIVKLGAEKAGSVGCANGEYFVYKIHYRDKELALFMCVVGSAGAGGMLEEVYALGVETVVVFGTCGVLDSSIGEYGIIIPNSAVRDEGLSYHYIEPSDEMAVNTEYIPAFTALLDRLGCSYTKGKVWTTDAFYRETKAKVKKRKEQGCVCVDMECSALAAVARFRGKGIFQFFYAHDDLGSEEWDRRCLDGVERFDDNERVAGIALEFAASLTE